MLDGIKIFVPREQLVNFDKSSLVSGGPSFYVLKRQLNDRYDVKLKFKEGLTGLTIEGSIGYTIKGNSIELLSTTEVKEFFKGLSEELGIDLFKAKVKYFEAGVCIETPFTYIFFANNHVGVPKMKSCTIKKDGSKLFSNNKLRSIKFYDANKNIKAKTTVAARDLFSSRGVYDPSKNYIKYEDVYLNPPQVFDVPVFTVNELFDEAIISFIKEDVLESYQSIIKTGYEVKCDKGDLDTNAVLAITLKKIELQTGINISELINFEWLTT